MATTKRPSVELDQEVIVEIEDLTHQGQGVGRINGMALFVPGALPGDQVKAKVSMVKKNFAHGELKQVIKPSPDRVESDCPISSQCGGCQLRGFKYEAQLEWKRRQVEEALKRIGGLQDIGVKPILGMNRPDYYRNKSQFRAGTFGYGFYEQGTNDFVQLPPEGCRLQQEPINRIVTGLGHVVKGIKGVLIRSSRLNQETMVVLVTRSRYLPNEEGLVELIRKSFPEVVSIYHNVNPREKGPFLGQEFTLLYGKETIEDSVGELRFQISPNSFFQVNSAQTETLYRKAKEFANLKGHETVFDLYCGIGTISLYLASRCKEVVGIEEVYQATRDAEKNAKLNRIENVTFRTGRVEETLPQLLEYGAMPDLIVLDPPRAGAAKEVIDAITKTEVARIVYVSCNPATLARDLKMLTEQGYRVEEVQPVDMFPHTSQQAETSGNQMESLLHLIKTHLRCA